MRILKINPLLKLINSYLVDSSQPSNINYAWNFGSLLATCLIIQIITGVTLAMHYNSSVFEAFNSVEHVMRDVNNGWLIRYLHANTASAFFLLVYFHIGRGLYYGSYKFPRTLVWAIGTVILILMMAIAFLGYTCSPKWSNFDSYYIYDRFNELCLPILTSNKLIHKRSYSETKYINHKTAAADVNKTSLSSTVTDFISHNNLSPAFVYEDLDKDPTRKLINSDTKNLSGIYLILNKVTLDYYVGSASTNRLYARFSNHLIYHRGSKVVKQAVKKYKLACFAFIIIELFPYVVNKENNKQLIDREDFYLKSLLPNYNILTEAGNTFGYKHTTMDRLKMKNNYSDKRRELIGSLNKGKKFSEETIEKMKHSALIRSKPLLSEYAQLNMKKRSKPVTVYNLDKSVYGSYSSITSASYALNCDVKTINRALRTEKKIVKKRFVVEHNIITP